MWPTIQNYPRQYRKISVVQYLLIYSPITMVNCINFHSAPGLPKLVFQESFPYRSLFIPVELKTKVIFLHNKPIILVVRNEGT